MSAVAAAVSPTLTADATHVFADAGVDPRTARTCAVIDPVFLAEAGWDAHQLVLSPPSEHPLLGRPVCRAEDCSTTAPDRSRICASCRRRLAEHGLDEDEVASLPTRVQPTSQSQVPLSAPLHASRGCAVAACTRQRRHRNGAYCEAHQQRLRTARSRDLRLDEQLWQRTEPAIGRGGEVSLRGLPPLLIAEVLLGLQQRCRINAVKTDDAILRSLCDDLRRQQVSSLARYVIADGRGLEFTGLANCPTGYARRALATPETEVVKDEWDLVVFGHSGTVSFAKITQQWLREAAKRWAADDLPQRRVRPGRRTSAGLSVRHHVGCLVRLSESLGMRPDRGGRPAALGRADMEAFLHRLAYLQSVGRLSGDARMRACREVRAVLGRIRAMG